MVSDEMLAAALERMPCLQVHPPAATWCLRGALCCDAMWDVQEIGSNGGESSAVAAKCTSCVTGRLLMSGIGDTRKHEADRIQPGVAAALLPSAEGAAPDRDSTAGRRFPLVTAASHGVLHAPCRAEWRCCSQSKPGLCQSVQQVRHNCSH